MTVIQKKKTKNNTKGGKETTQETMATSSHTPSHQPAVLPVHHSQRNDAVHTLQWHDSVLFAKLL